MTRALPWSERTEQSVLGAVLNRPGLIDRLALTPKSFHGPANRAIWAAMQSLTGKELDIDQVTLEGELETSGQLAAIGGLAYIGTLAAIVPHSAHYGSYAEQLEGLRVERACHLACAEALAESESGGEALLTSLFQKLGSINRCVANEKTALAEIMPDFLGTLFDDVDAQSRGEIHSSFMPTGVEPIDEKIGGLPRGTVTAIGGRPGAGKSSLLLTMAESAARLGEVAVIFTTEDPRDRWMERLIAKKSGVPVDRIYGRTLGPTDLNQITHASELLVNLKGLHVVHAHGMGAEDIVRTATALEARWVAVDYIQKIRPPRPPMALHEAIEANSKTFGDFAGQSGAVVVVASQLSKDIERDARRPTLGDLRYGDGLAQEAKLVLLIHDAREEYSEAREILVAKRNMGESDQRIALRFDGAHCKFQGAA